MKERARATARTAAVPAADMAEGSGRRSARLRQRAAWMYYVEEMTQNAIAEALGIGRVTVVRLLADARAMREVRISLSRDVAELPRLERGLEKAFGIREVIVAPLSQPGADPTSVIGAATGRYVSDILRPEMRLGVGWGRTLFQTLGFLEERSLPSLAVVSMLGGISTLHGYNPAEFAWQFSRLFQADCHLIAAPALVDSVETKRILIERCGIGPVLDMANALDAVLVSVGGMTKTSTTSLFGYFTEEDRQALIAKGAVGDILYNFFDRDGRILDDPLNRRVMGVEIEQLRRTPQRILTSGGHEKIEGIRGALKLLEPTVFITDERTADELLAGA